MTLSQSEFSFSFDAEGVIFPGELPDYPEPPSTEHQQAIVRHIVERVEIQDGVVVGIDTRPEARPFFEGMAVAPPDGFEPPTRTLGECRSIH